MAYIQPDGIVEFYGDLGLSPNYENTLYFRTRQEKDDWFGNNYPILERAQALSYSRHTRGFIRVEKSMSRLIRASYMRFKNSSFEDKWFYAFINSVEYINNITTQVNFELDVLMTWMGDYSLTPCFIERQHSTTDAVGDNIVDEGIPCGDFVNDYITTSGFIGSSGFWYCFASTFDPTDGSDTTGSEYGGIYSGVMYSYTNDVTTLNNWINNNLTKVDGIVGISVVPYQFITDAGNPAVEKGQTFVKPYNDQTYANFQGYVPKNNKLFIYPYKSLQVTNMEGNFAEFRWEFFSGTHAQFEFIGTTGLQSEIICSPINYKGSQGNITEKMSMSDFPLCSWSYDAFKAYLAQNKSSIAANAVSSATSLLGGLALTNATGIHQMRALSFNRDLSPRDKQLQYNNLEFARETAEFSQLSHSFTDVLGTIGTLMDYSRKPQQASGSQGTNPLIGRPIGHQKKDFYFIAKGITAEYAQMIDNYFSMFGYKQNKIAVPNCNARKEWTYVKTVGCVVHGNIPADDMARIEAIFDNGIRFWNNIAHVGQFNIPNPVWT